MRSVVLRLFLTIVVLSFAACNAGNPGVANAAKPARDVKVEVKSHDEIQAAIKEHAGKVVVVDTWSTSCEPCMKEFPGLVGLHKKYGAEKVVCVSVSCDYEGIGKPDDVVPKVLEFLKEQKATFQNFLCKDDSDTLFRKLGIPSIPAVFIYGKDGALAKKIAADFNYAKDVEPVVAELVK